MQTKETPGFKFPTDGSTATNRVTAKIVRTPDGELLTQYHVRGRVFRSIEALQEARA